VELVAGTYTVSINPINSGRTAYPITYRAASGATVTITGTGKLLNLANGQDYITVQNITFSEPSGDGGRHLDALDASGIILDGCRFMDDADGNSSYSTCRVENGTDWEVSNCFFDLSNISTVNYRTHNGLEFKNCQRVYIHHNMFGDIPHTALMVQNYCWDFWITHNIFNNKWRHAIGLQFYNAGIPSMAPNRILIEHNEFREVGSGGNTNPMTGERPRPVHSIEHQGYHVIVRFNTFDKVDMGFSFFSETNKTIKENWLYHNTIYHSTRKSWISNSNSGTSSATNFYGEFTNNYIVNNIMYDAEGRDFSWTDQGGTVTGNHIQNNIINDSENNTHVYYLGTNYYSIASLEAAVSQFSNNFNTNPLLIGPENGHFQIGEGSGAIDNGRFLATIAAVNGNQLTLGANEAYAFADDMGITGRAGDTIYDDNGNSAVIASIDAHNKITLDNAAGFTVNGKITVVKYSGTAPDIGRYESLYTGTSGILENENHKGLELYVYPNPSNGKEVTVAFKLPDVSGIIIRILDGSGKTMKILSDEKRIEGYMWQGLIQAIINRACISAN